MKKLLNVSVIAALAVLPLAANATAADVDKQPTSIDMEAANATTTAAGATATNAPKYELALPNANDSNVATAGYVKGAYNASIRAINKVADQVNGIDTNLEGKANADLSNVENGAVTTDLIEDGAVTADKLATDVLDGFATEAGVEQTVSNAINGMSASVDLSGLTVANAAVGGTATASFNVMNEWGSETVTTNGVTGTVDLTSTTTNVTLSGDSANQTVTLTKPAQIQYAEPTEP